ncbi:transcription factor IIIB 60 kDa subunit isoform X1 [Solanum dulcamara]|uniref:transcription factor IIIB 60 kDa subunit isoform X1 n=2 Tax=Solanum dulcamara TaxID=45834 RepID=UPI002484EABC|nr:transcription factor IIIB 60 kDa subunit isoform X1 [Solanum dulcamara]
MVWCVNCAQDKPTKDVDGKICCSFCGKVLEEDNFSIEPTFVKNASGQSQLSGSRVSTVQSNYSASRERTLKEAYEGIEGMLCGLGIDGGESIAHPALSFYKIAVEKSFTKGRRKEQVQAACLYIACRENKKPFLLIDFSEYLRINVYILGAVFLQLCKILHLEEHPIVQKPVDPSLFIHRFTDRLFGGRHPNISRSALHILASMKRDWMQTGRKPSGLCGAALYIASLSHGLSCSKSEIIKVVHICEATLTKRLIEFENTESGSLTIDEFNTRAEELEKEETLSLQLYSGSKGSGITEVLCEHKKSVKLPFAHGLCERCYTDFVKLSGGLDGGSEPPSFQRAERERLMAKQDAEEIAGDPSFPMSNQMENNVREYLEPEKGGNTQCVKNVHKSGSEQVGSFSVVKTDHIATPDTLHGMDGIDHDESENFSDIDDAEVDSYLHNEQEKHYKKIIWETMNREYLEEQAAKEAAALEAKKHHEFILANCPEDVQKFAAATAASVAKSKKEKQQKRAAELKNSGPAQTATEATKQMLAKKRLSSKINYDVLEKLFDDSATENPKKARTAYDSMDDNGVKSDKIDPEVDETYEEAFGEDVHYGEDVGGYDYDQHYDLDDY